MAFSNISQSGHITYGLMEYVLDKETDLDNLPINVKMGSTALVIATGKVYMINS